MYENRFESSGRSYSWLFGNIIAMGWDGQGEGVIGQGKRVYIYPSKLLPTDLVHLVALLGSSRLPFSDSSQTPAWLQSPARPLGYLLHATVVVFGLVPSAMS